LQVYLILQLKIALPKLSPGTAMY
jgi:RNA recognition motif-containing protein